MNQNLQSNRKSANNIFIPQISEIKSQIKSQSRHAKFF